MPNEKLWALIKTLFKVYLPLLIIMSMVLLALNAIFNFSWGFVEISAPVWAGSLIILSCWGTMFGASRIIDFVLWLRNKL